MGLGCFGSTLKCLFIFFNVIFALVGAATVGFGVYLKVSPEASQLVELIEVGSDVVYLAYGSWVIIGFGALVFIVAFFGCVGAATSSRCLLGLYVIVSSLIVIGQIGAFVLTVMFVVRSDDVQVFENQVRTAFVKEYKPENEKFVKSWDTIQIWFSCCGISNYTDYSSNIIATVPLSCCKQLEGSTADAMKVASKLACLAEAATKLPLTQLNSVGCFTKLKETVKQYSTVLLIIEAVVIAITIIGVIIACCLCRRHDKKDL